MGTGFNALAQAGIQDKIARRNELEDEQRKATLKTLQEDAETPQDKLAAVQAVYHKDPGVLKQHVENMTRKLTGKPTQPVVSPQDAQAARIAPLAARGKTPDQQALEQQQASGDIKNKEAAALQQKETQQKQQSITDLITKYVPKDQQAAALEDYTRKQAGIQQTLKNLPGAAGQPYKSASGQWVRPVQSADGAIGEQPMPAGWTPTAAAPKQSNAALATYLRAKYGDSPTAEQIEEGTREHQRMMSGLTVGSHQTVAYDANGVPHVITLSTTSRKDFGTGKPTSDGGASKGPAPKKAAGAQPKPNQLDFHRATPQSNAAKKAVDTAENSFLDVQKASQDPTPVGDQGVILAWLRGRVNRVTNTEIQAVNNLGGARMKLEGTIVRIESGKMTDQQRKWFLRSAKDNYDNAQTVAGKYDNPAPKAAGKGKSLADRLDEALQ